jgi:hypothetical protein
MVMQQAVSKSGISIDRLLTGSVYSRVCRRVVFRAWLFDKLSGETPARRPTVGVFLCRNFRARSGTAALPAGAKKKPPGGRGPTTGGLVVHLPKRGR